MIYSRNVPSPAILSGQMDRCLDSFIERYFPDEPIAIDRTKPKDYVRMIRELTALIPSSYDELADPKLCRRQNKAGTDLHKLRMELFARPDKGGPIILQLLQNEDPRVRIGAGAYCLQAQIFEDLGRSVLMQLAADPSLHSYLQFAASMNIKYCTPYKAQ